MLSRQFSNFWETNLRVTHICMHSNAGVNHRSYREFILDKASISIQLDLTSAKVNNESEILNYTNSDVRVKINLFQSIYVLHVILFTYFVYLSINLLR